MLSRHATILEPSTKLVIVRMEGATCYSLATSEYSTNHIKTEDRLFDRHDDEHMLG